LLSKGLLDFVKGSGEIFGSEDQSLFFHALIKIYQYQNILELGTGVGVSTFMLAQACKENKKGHVWTIDDGCQWNSRVIKRIYSGNPSLKKKLEKRGLKSKGDIKFSSYFDCLSKELNLENWTTLLTNRFEVRNTKSLAPFLKPVIKKPIDFVFSDITNFPIHVLAIFSKFLPYMAPSSSYFFDSACSHLDTLMAMENTINALNGGKIPEILLAGRSSTEIQKIMKIAATRNFTLVPMPERKHRRQNGALWIKIEPVNFLADPKPSTWFRDYFIPMKELDKLFKTGKIPSMKKLWMSS